MSMKTCPKHHRALSSRVYVAGKGYVDTCPTCHSEGEAHNRRADEEARRRNDYTLPTTLDTSLPSTFDFGSSSPAPSYDPPSTPDTSSSSDFGGGGGFSGGGGDSSW